MSASQDPAPRAIPGGEPCPKCGHAMQRFEHSTKWKPLRGRGFFEWWDRCKPCSHIQHYEAARQAAAE